MYSGVVFYLHGHDEAACHWNSSFALFLQGHINQLREQRLSEATHLWMLKHHRSERAPIPANTQRFLPCLSFHQTTEFIENLDSCFQSHAQLSRRDLPLGSHAPPHRAQQVLSLLRCHPLLQDFQELAIGLRE